MYLRCPHLRLENVGTLEKVIMRKMGSTHYNYTLVHLVKGLKPPNIARHFEILPHKIHNAIL
jgi:hypothetical protein